MTSAKAREAGMSNWSGALSEDLRKMKENQLTWELTEKLSKAEKRIAEQAAEITGLREKIARKEAAITALQEGCRALIADKDATEAENATLREQVGRVPVCAGHVEAQDYARLVASDPIFDVTVSGTKRTIQDDHFIHPVYIDPPAGGVMTDLDRVCDEEDEFCHRCGSRFLDTGWECTECGYDNMKFYCEPLPPAGEE